MAKTAVSLVAREGEVAKYADAEGKLVADAPAGAKRDVRCWCVACYAKWPAIVAKSADRCGHTCPVCGAASGLEV